MKKITCIQQYVIDNLIEDEILSTNSLLSAVSKVCSEEQFNNILSILSKHLFLGQTCTKRFINVNAVNITASLR